MRLLESTSAIAGSALEQATWFRRGLQVRTGKNLTESTNASPRESKTPNLSGIHTVASDTVLFDSALSKSIYGSQDLAKSINGMLIWLRVFLKFRLIANNEIPFSSSF